ncbi:signal peptide peptidase SppA [Polymorphobacter sp.]|uniref:signal peptide peptidase SppA n=1 Tax=Polymorphobacter sp. TaxID=1909290 RepID=UPI003F72EEA6
MSFARGTWRFLVGVKDLLVLLLLLLFFAALWAALGTRASIKVPDGGALVLSLEGGIVDQASDQDPLQLAMGAAGRTEVQARDIIHAIDMATTDDRIKLIVLDLDTFVGAGQANLQSIAASLQRFRKSGKPIEAYATAYTDDGYYLASSASRIWLNPLGAVLLTGPGGRGLYFQNALNKLDVDVEVFRVGTYKAAVEPFTRTDASPEAKAADQALVDGLWQSWRSDITARRTRVDVAAWLRALPQRIAAADGDQSRAAQAAGLIDRIGNRHEFDKAILAQVGESATPQTMSYNGIGLDGYVAASRSLLPQSGPAVGIVYVSGNIVDGEAGRGTAGGTTIADTVRKALAENKDLKAIVVRIDSPGGSVTASEEIREALLEAKSAGMPLVASMGPVAASGGYWIASAADEIIAQPIGVFAIIPTFPRALASLGITSDGVKSTPYSGEPDVVGGIGPETRQLLQISVEDIYRRFTGLVAASRKMPVEEVNRIGQGRVWSGADAQRLRLVDGLGGLDAAVAAAARRAKLEGTPRTIDIEPRLSPVLEFLNAVGGPAETAPQGRDPFAKLSLASRSRLFGLIGDLRLMAAGPTMQATCIECAAMGSPRLASAARIETEMAKLVRP